MSTKPCRYLMGSLRPLAACVLLFGGALLGHSQSLPSIQAVITASNFGGFSAIAPGSGVEIRGSNLALQTQGWTFDKFLTPHSGPSISSVQVTIAGETAFVSYISPGQINVQLPVDLPLGSQEVTVSNENGTSAPFGVSIDRVAPGLWTLPDNAVSEGSFVGALYSDGVTYAIPPGEGALLSLPARYPHPGDVITLYGVGFGPLSPLNVHLDTAPANTRELDLPFRLFFGKTEAKVKYAGLAPNLVGFYRFDVVVPDTDPRNRNEIPITFKLGDIPGNQTLFSDETERKATEESITVNGVSRTYLLYVPRNYEPGESALIVALHGRGGGGPGTALEMYSDLDDKADREGFAVAYPDGLVDATGTLNWNYYYDPFFANAPDDVSFLREVINALKEKISPDPRRIYITGTSAGGFMTQRAGVELSDLVAAIGVVQGELYVFLPTSPQTIPAAKAPVSVLFLKGDKDPVNQYCGAIFPGFNVVESSSDQDFAYWSGPATDQCSQVDTPTPLCVSPAVLNPQFQGTPGVLTSIVEKHASGCKAHTEVQFYRLLGGVDMWNGSRMDVPDKIPYNPDLNDRTGITTNDILWNFFREHPKLDAPQQDR